MLEKSTMSTVPMKSWTVSRVSECCSKPSQILVVKLPTGKLDMTPMASRAYKRYNLILGHRYPDIKIWGSVHILDRGEPPRTLDSTSIWQPDCNMSLTRSSFAHSQSCATH